MEGQPDPQRPTTAKSIISQVAKPGCEQAFEAWLHEIAQVTAKAPGHQSVTILRPPPGGREYTVILHFDCEDNLERWLKTDTRRAWVERGAMLTEVPERRAEVSGIEHWFTLPGRPELRRPARLKMALLTILVVYPTILALTRGLSPVLQRMPPLLAPLLVTICLTTLLTYVLLPNVTRVFHGWLYPDREPTK